MTLIAWNRHRIGHRVVDRGKRATSNLPSRSAGSRAAWWVAASCVSSMR
jgi:hypothetical protein